MGPGDLSNGIGCDVDGHNETMKQNISLHRRWERVENGGCAKLVAVNVVTMPRQGHHAKARPQSFWAL